MLIALATFGAGPFKGAIIKFYPLMTDPTATSS